MTAIRRTEPGITFATWRSANRECRPGRAPKKAPLGVGRPASKKARGQYVYIATSDDTMPPDCLEKMVAALDRNRECDLAHCNLRVIDQEGKTSRNWWTTESLFARQQRATPGPAAHSARAL